MVIAINNYITEKQGTEDKFMKHGSSWFNGDYQDYLENSCISAFDESSINYSDYDEMMLEKQNIKFIN